MAHNIWYRESGRKMSDPFSAVGRVKFSLDQIFFDGIRGSDPVQSFGNAHPPHRPWFVGLVTKCAGTPQKRTTHPLSDPIWAAPWRLRPQKMAQRGPRGGGRLLFFHTSPVQLSNGLRIPFKPSAEDNNCYKLVFLFVVSFSKWFKVNRS